MIPTDPVERDALAAEYVLGTLDAHAARQVEQAMEADADLRDMVAAWEARLSPLTALTLPEAPPPGLWERIATSLDGPATPAPAMARPSPFWRFWALGASAVAAGLAAFLVLRPAPEQRLMTVLLAQRDQPAWVVEADGGALRLAP